MTPAQSSDDLHEFRLRVLVFHGDGEGHVMGSRILVGLGLALTCSGTK